MSAKVDWRFPLKTPLEAHQLRSETRVYQDRGKGYGESLANLNRVTANIAEISVTKLVSSNYIISFKQTQFFSSLIIQAAYAHC